MEKFYYMKNEPERDGASPSSTNSIHRQRSTNFLRGMIESPAEEIEMTPSSTSSSEQFDFSPSDSNVASSSNSNSTTPEPPASAPPEYQASAPPEPRGPSPSSSGSGRGPSPSSSGSGRGPSPSSSGSGRGPSPSSSGSGRGPSPSSSGSGRGPSPSSCGSGRGPSPSSSGSGRGPSPSSSGSGRGPSPSSSGSGQGPSPSSSGSGRGPSPSNSGSGKAFSPSSPPLRGPPPPKPPRQLSGSTVGSGGETGFTEITEAEFLQMEEDHQRRASCDEKPQEDEVDSGSKPGLLNSLIKRFKREKVRPAPLTDPAHCLFGSDNLAFVNDDGEEELHKGGGDEVKMSQQQEGSREDNLIRLSSLFGEQQPHRQGCPFVTEMMTKNVCDCQSQQICHESQQKEDDWDVESNVSDADSMEERMFGHSNFETFRLEDLSGKCDLCEEFKTLEEDERRLKWEMVALVFFFAIFAAGMAVLVRDHWIVSCLNANTYTTKIIGIPPRDPLSDYGVQYLGGVAYLDVAVTKDEKWMLHEAVTTGLSTGSLDGTHASFNLLYSSYSSNNQSELVVQVDIHYRVWCPEAYHSRKRCSRRKEYIVTMTRDKEDQVWASHPMAPSRAFCRAYLGPEHCNVHACD